MPAGYPESYYAASSELPPERPTLTGEARADVCVVGGGYTGLWAALHLGERGARVTLVEAGRIGHAASGRNGGQVHTGYRRDQGTLERRLGRQHARALWDIAEEAKAALFARIQRHKIACEPARGLLHAAHDGRAFRALAREANHLAQHYGCTQLRLLDAAETRGMTGSGIYAGALYDAGGGQLHPLALTLGLARAAEAAGVRIHENAPVRALEEDGGTVRVRLDGANVTAGHVILACDAFIGGIAPALAPYLAQLESYIVATAPLPPELDDAVLPTRIAVADTRHVLDYYRKSGDNRLLFAGGETYFAPARDIAGLVRPHMLRVYPMLGGTPIEYAWRGTVGITRTRLPHFGRLGPRVLFGYGYSGQGVALAAAGGRALAEAAAGESDRFETLAGVPPERFPGGALLRKPLVAAALFAYKLLDRL